LRVVGMMVVMTVLVSGVRRGVGVGVEW